MFNIKDTIIKSHTHTQQQHKPYGAGYHVSFENTLMYFRFRFLRSKNTKNI